MTPAQLKAHRAYLKANPSAQVTARILWVNPYSRSWYIRKVRPELVRMAQVPIPAGITLKQVKAALSALCPLPKEIKVPCHECGKPTSAPPDMYQPTCSDCRADWY